MSDWVPASLRRLVQQRARHQCEYCLIHEDDAGVPHQIDHILARKHGGETDEANLAWSCFLCNNAKGTDFTSIDPLTKKATQLFSPRTDSWSDHFRIEEGRIVPLTPEGRATERLLQLNLPELIASRQELMGKGLYPRFA